MSLDSLLSLTINHHSDDKFSHFISSCQAQYDKPVHTMTQMRMRQDKKLRGDLFEEFCQRYLIHIYPVDFESVWLFSQVPSDVKENLGLKNQDLGIDIICLDKLGNYYAVQVKYRKHNPHKTTQIIGWKQLSTFYALVYRTGPFHKHIVMTNVNGVRHVSKKTKKDVSICKRRFENMSFWDWQKLVNDKVVGNEEKLSQQLSPEELRQKRLDYFNLII